MFKLYISSQQRTKKALSSNSSYHFIKEHAMITFNGSIDTKNSEKIEIFHHLLLRCTVIGSSGEPGKILRLLSWIFLSCLEATKIKL